MVPLIDVSLIQKITFNDERLLNDFLDEWVIDARKKMVLIHDRNSNGSGKLLFWAIHELKTNFTMLSCSEAIRYVDQLLKQLELDNSITQKDVNGIEERLTHILNELKRIYGISGSYPMD